MKKATKNKERVILFADSDLDGVTSLMMMKEVIRRWGGEVSGVYISDREKWGYGLSKEAVRNIEEEAPALLISLDCGISNFEGAKEAKRKGYELIIIDHHKTFSELPEASLILDPLQEGDEYPFKKMSNGGIVYKLVKEILGDSLEGDKRFFLELAALSTLADMVPKKEDNKEILDEGADLLKNSMMTPLRVLRERFEGEDPLERMISLLNITRPRGNLNTSYLFLNSKEDSEAREWMNEVEEENRKRREKIEAEEKKMLETLDDSDDQEVIFWEGDFPPSLAGTLASRVIRRFKKPVFLYVVEGETVRGSCRALSGQDVVEAMRYCGDCLDNFGGHPEAAGFTTKKEKMEDFERCVQEYFRKNSKNEN